MSPIFSVKSSIRTSRPAPGRLTALSSLPSGSSVILNRTVPEDSVPNVAPLVRVELTRDTASERVTISWTLTAGELPDWVEIMKHDVGPWHDLFPHGSWRASIVHGGDTVWVDPSGSPFAGKGRIVYRIGDPIHYEDMAPFHIKEDYIPFSAAAERDHLEPFQALAALVTDRINPLLDPEYQLAEETPGDVGRGVDRFL